MHDEQNRDDYMDEDDLEAERRYIERQAADRRIAADRMRENNERVGHD